MKLSKLAYLCVKAATDYGDASFTYPSYLKGEAEQNQDYASAIDKVFLPINSFFQRLSTLNKIPARIASFDCKNSSEITPAVSPRMGKVISVFQFNGSGYATLDARVMGKSILIIGRYDKSLPVQVQYRPQVSSMGESEVEKMEEAQDASGNLYWVVAGTTYNSLSQAVKACDEEQLDLYDEYGITEEMCSLCIDWCKAKLNDDPTLGRAQEVDCESRISALDLGETLYTQRFVKRVF